jgi:outer membrane receptor protein involved in Fe transport
MLPNIFFIKQRQNRPIKHLTLLLIGLFCNSLLASGLSDTVNSTEKTTEPTTNRHIATSSKTANQSSENESSNNSNANIKDAVIIVTGKRRAHPLLNTPQSITSISSDTIDFIQPTHSNELSSFVPGMWISRGNGQEHLTAIRSPVFTGPGSCAEFLIMENNIPVRAKGFCNVNQLFDANIAQASSVEVLRGANSALYGSDAIHGTVNVITTEFDRALPAMSSAQLSAGEDDDISVSSQIVSLYDPAVTKRHKYALKFQGTHDNGFKHAAGFDQQKLSAEHLFISTDYDIHTLFSASNLNQETAGYLQQGENAYRNDALLRQNDFPEAFRDARSFRLQSNIKPSSGSWEITPYARANDMTFLMHFLPGQPVEKNGHDSVGIHFQWIPIESNKLTLQTGFDSELTRGYLNQYQPAPTNTGSAFLNEVLPQGQHYDYTVNSKSAAVFTNADFHLSDTINFSTGLRLDYISFQYNNQMQNGNSRDNGTTCGFGGCRYTRPADRRDSFTEPSAFIAMNVSLDNQQQFFAKLDTAHRTPQATELYRLQNGQSSANIEPQSATSLEAGYRSRNDGDAFEAVVFSMRKRHVIFQNNQRQWVNGAKTAHQGIEFSWQQRLSGQWSLKGVATYAEHTYQNNPDLRGSNQMNINGNDIDTAPKFIAAMHLNWRPTPDIRAALEWQHLSSYYLNPENTEQYSGHQLFHFRLARHLTPKTRLLIQVKNITNKNYAERADFAFGNHRYFVGEPRQFYLTVEQVF